MNDTAGTVHESDRERTLESPLKLDGVLKLTRRGFFETICLSVSFADIVKSDSRP